MRPALKPGLSPVWRNRDTVQIGIDPRRAIALTGMRDAARLLTLLDGSRDRAQVLAAARDLGIGPEAADRVLALLAAGGALDDVPARLYHDLPAAARSRLAPELATAALAHGDGDGGARTLARRQSACVRVHGATRVGLRVAALLSAAGVGRVVCTGPVGAPPEDGLRAWDVSADVLVGPASPDMPAGGQGSQPGLRPDLVVLADSHERDLPAALVRQRVPHLAVSGGEAIGVVGPLVTPGRSACLRCLDLTRAELDPAWPLILAQLVGHVADPPACDAVLAAAVAAQAAGQALTFIDRGARGVAVTNGTLELVLPDWQWRRRSWPSHHRCGCGSRAAS